MESVVRLYDVGRLRAEEEDQEDDGEEEDGGPDDDDDDDDDSDRSDRSGDEDGDDCKYTNILFKEKLIFLLFLPATLDGKKNIIVKRDSNHYVWVLGFTF